MDHILTPVLWPFWYWESRYSNPRDAVAVEDGAPAHRAGFTKLRQEEYGMPKFDWPASSPDLNPIENI